MADSMLFNRQFVSTIQQQEGKPFENPNCYIYFYHTDILMSIPTIMDGITDNMSVSFKESKPLSRPAPIYSYSDAGPRTLQFNFELRRDMMNQINQGVSNITVKDADYVETLINNIYAASVPKFNSSEKMIDPPVVAVKLEDTLFIKGVINGAVSVKWDLPVLRDGKYAKATIGFSVSEITPYSADELQLIGGYRDSGDVKLPQGLNNNYYKMVTPQVRSVGGRNSL